MRHHQERIKVPVIAGEREDLDKITVRVPFKTSYQVQALAKAKRQSVSLYLSKVLKKHVEDPDT